MSTTNEAISTADKAANSGPDKQAATIHEVAAKHRRKAAEHLDQSKASAVKGRSKSKLE